LAWLSSTWLAQILLQIQSPKFQALINHTDTHHRLGQYKQHGNYIHQHVVPGIEPGYIIFPSQK
jgi:hypothetical protein